MEWCAGLRHDAREADALAEVLVARVVREAAELVRDRLRQGRLVDVRVLRLLARELGIEVRCVQYRFLQTDRKHMRSAGDEHDMMSAQRRADVNEDERRDARRWA